TFHRWRRTGKSRRAARSGSRLAEELGPVASRDGNDPELAVAHDLQCQALTGLVLPQTDVKVPPAVQLLGIQRDDDVSLLQSAAIARAVGDDAGHPHAFLEDVSEDAEPGPPGPTDRAAVTQELALMLLVEIDRDGKRASRDLVQVEGEGTHQLSLHGEEPASTESRVGGAGHHTAVEQVFPVRLDLPEVGHKSARHPALLGSGGGQSHHRVAPLEGGVSGRAGSLEVLALHAQQGQTDLEVLTDDLRLHAPAAGEGDLDVLRAHDDV